MLRFLPLLIEQRIKCTGITECTPPPVYFCLCALNSPDRHLNLILGLFCLSVLHDPILLHGTLSVGQRRCCYTRGFRCVITPIYSAGSSINTTKLHTYPHLRFTLSRGTEKLFKPAHKRVTANTKQTIHFLLQLQYYKICEIRS